MKIKKYHICKKTAFHMNGERSFELGQKYEFRKTMGNGSLIFLILNDQSMPVSKEFFKEVFEELCHRFNRLKPDYQIFGL